MLKTIWRKINEIFTFEELVEEVEIRYVPQMVGQEMSRKEYDRQVDEALALAKRNRAAS